MDSSPAAFLNYVLELDSHDARLNWNRISQGGKVYNVGYDLPPRQTLTIAAGENYPLPTLKNMLLIQGDTTLSVPFQPSRTISIQIYL
jgi:hypothetical protein